MIVRKLLYIGCMYPRVTLRMEEDSKCAEEVNLFFFKNNTDEVTDNSENLGMTELGVTTKMLEEKVEKLAVKIGWHLLRISYKMLQIQQEYPNSVNTARKKTNYEALLGKKKNPKDYSGSQVEYESTGTCCCKNEMYHSQMHKRERCLQVIHWETHCVHLLQQDFSWRTMSLEH